MEQIEPELGQFLPASDDSGSHGAGLGWSTAGLGAGGLGFAMGCEHLV